MTFRLWIPALVGALCQTFGIGLLGAFGFFVVPLSQEFAVGVATISVAPVLLLLAPALVGPAVGRKVDTHSIRAIMLLGVVLANASLFGLSFAPGLGLIGAAFLAFAIGQTLYGPLVLNSLLIKTYQENVAAALAIAAMGVSLGSVLLPYFVAWLMDNFSWRETLQVLAIATSAVLFSVIRLGLPRFPPVAAAADSEPLLQSAQANRYFLRTPAFWIIGIAISIVFNMALMLMVCYAPHFGQQGFSNSEIASFIAAGGVAGFTAKLLVASFVDRWRKHLKGIAVCVVLLMMLGVATLLRGETFVTNALGAAMIGGSGGAFLPLHPYLNSRYFEAAVIGGVSGAQAPLMLPLGLISAPLAGYAFDVSGSYEYAFMGAIALLVAAALLLATLPAAVGELEKICTPGV